MDTYSFLRELADSWILLAMFGFFAGAAIWAFLPSQSSAREDASMIPFRKEGDGPVGLGSKDTSSNTEAKSHD
jgi:cytochrome c oxidase cbb3-type subunit 4